MTSLQNISSPGKKGRPKNISQEANFIKLCEWLEMEGDMYSVLELYEQTKTIAGTSVELDHLFGSE